LACGALDPTPTLPAIVVFPVPDTAKFPTTPTLPVVPTENSVFNTAGFTPLVAR
jgi:hypothetical protein